MKNKCFVFILLVGLSSCLFATDNKISFNNISNKSVVMKGSISFDDVFSGTPSEGGPLSSEDINPSATFSNALAFPSPAVNGETKIGFQVSKGPIALELFLYDSVGSKLCSFESIFDTGYNRIPISETELGYQLPTGVYYYVLRSESSISKGKFAVITKGGGQ